MTTIPPTRLRSSTGLLAILLAGLVIAVYWPAATYPFVNWDDQIHLVQNPLMHPPSWEHILVYWWRPYFGLYVPVTYTIWTLLAMVGQTPDANGIMTVNPYLFHCLNIGTHFLAALLVWRIVYRLTGRVWPAWLGAAIFAVHPLCVEPVAWVSGFRDVLSGVLGFAALLAYMGEANARRGEVFSVQDGAGTPRLSRDSRIAWYVVATFLFLLAILAKPGAVAVLPMALVIDLFWTKRQILVIGMRLGPWVVAAVVLGWMTGRIQGLPPTIDVPVWWQRPLVAGDAMVFYVEKLVLPIRLCVQYPHSPHEVLAGHGAVTSTIIAIFVMLALYLLGRRWRWVWICAGLFAAGLVPVLGFVPFVFQHFSTVADRYVYLAMLGPATAMAFVIASSRRVVSYMAIGCILVLAVLSFKQVLVWRDTQTLFTHVLAINPRSNLAMVKLSREALMRGDAQAAERLAKQALDAEPSDSWAWITLGASLENLHEKLQARNCYLHVIQTDPSRDSAGAYSNLAAMDAEGGDFADAILLYQQALRHDSDLPEAQIGLMRAEKSAAGKVAGLNKSRKFRESLTPGYFCRVCIYSHWCRKPRIAAVASREGRHSAFTLIELLVVIAIIGVLMAILLPTLEHVRHQAYISECASNLRQIGQSVYMYENDNSGQFPRTTYVADATPVFGTGANAIDPFQTGGPSPNDITAAVYLLRRVEKLPGKIFCCPYDDVFHYQPDASDPNTHSNFPNYQLNLGYSFANPYPSTAAAHAGYQLTNHLRGDFPIAADMNPGTTDFGDDLFDPMPNSADSVQEGANSENHERDGQNVLYADGHVDWHRNAFAGIGQDNIYTTQNGMVVASPANANDAVLLPTDDKN